MAKINKQEIIQKLVDELNLYPGKDLIPSELADKILAVYQINTEDITVNVEEKISTKLDYTLNTSDKTITVPAGKKWKILFGNIRFVTTATVGNRDMELFINDAAAAQMLHITGVAAVAASKTSYYTIRQGDVVKYATGGLARDENLVIPFGFTMLEGWTFRFWDLSAVDAAADDIFITLYVVETDI